MAFALIYAFITAAPLPLNHIFITNFIIGGIIAVLGIISVAEPGSLAYKPQNRQPNFQDFQKHTALTANKSGGDSKNSAKFIFIGIYVIAITALAQFIIS